MPSQIGIAIVARLSYNMLLGQGGIKAELWPCHSGLASLCGHYPCTEGDQVVAARRFPSARFLCSVALVSGLRVVILVGFADH
jgi:hypothetical protein